MRMPDDRVKSTSSSRDDRRKHDDYQRDRDRDRERERDRGDRDRDRRRDDRYRVERYEKDRRRHEKDYDRRRRSRSRSKSRGDRRRYRSKSKSRSVEKQRSEKKRRERSRSHDKAPPKDNDRKKRALSIEIEKELENLRRMSDLKAAKRMNDESLLLIPPPPPKFKESSSSSSSSNSSGSSDEDSRKKQSKEKPDFMRGDVPKVEFVKEIETEEERIEFQQKMQEKLQRHLASQGKVYPPPKHGPEINHATGFANDGSFLEMFKRMQEQQQEIAQQPLDESTQLYQIATGNQNPIPVPFVGRRRGGKILKTGLVKKAKAIDETAENPNDAWNVYLQEVKKYKNASCDADSKTRPLVK